MVTVETKAFQLVKFKGGHSTFTMCGSVRSGYLQTSKHSADKTGNCDKSVSTVFTGLSKLSVKGNHPHQNVPAPD